MTKLDDKAMQDFRSQVRGELIQPGDASYEEARKVYNGMIDKRPGADRPLRRRGRRDRARSTSPASSSCRWPCAAAGTTAPAWAPATTGW